MAFVNGLAYDTQMQRYIEKHTSVDGPVPIVKLLKAAQQYTHNKTGSTSTTSRKSYNQIQANNRNGRNHNDTHTNPQLNVLKTGRKEALTHDDPQVTNEANAEQVKAQQERDEKASNRAAASRRELEMMQEKMNSLKQLVEAQLNASNVQAGGQQRSTTPNGYQRNGYQNNWQDRNYNNNNGYGGNRRGGYNNNNGYNGRNRYDNRNNSRGGYNSDRGGNNYNRHNNYGNQQQSSSQMPRDARLDGQQQTRPPTTPSAPLQNNQHQVSGSTQTGASAYPGDTYNVFPQDNVYVGSHDGQSNDVRNDAGQA